MSAFHAKPTYPQRNMFSKGCVLFMKRVVNIVLFMPADGLGKHFGKYGVVLEAAIPTDHMNGGRPRGYAFVKIEGGNLEVIRNDKHELDGPF